MPTTTAAAATYSCSIATGSGATIPATVPNGSGGTTTAICGTTSLPGQTPAVDPALIIDLSDTVDFDDDGLIDISSLEQLNNMRHNLAGSSYKTSSTASGVLCGTATTIACRGYELTRSLDFASAGSYDSNSINTAWRPSSSDPDDATNSGWEPIGDNSNLFATIFEGNGYTISNLYSRRAGTVGLFGTTNSSATIRNIGIIDNALYSSSGTSGRIGGLVGQNNGTIIASYATGDVDGGGIEDRAGGLVGYNNGGTITASYATGDVDGGEDHNDRVGGLVGQNNGTITASYATGDADGGDDDSDRVGGLVGQNNTGTIYASYATGNADGGTGNSDRVGGLVGDSFYGTIIASYGFGTLTNVDTAGIDDSGNRPNGVAGVGSGPNGARFLTAANTPTAWNSASSNSMNAWIFGTTTDIPTLRYADYDGSGTTYSCSTIPATVPDGSGGTISVTCGTTPLPGQTPALTLLLNPFDTDGDRLIDITSLDRLHNMRHNLAGTSYKTSSGDRGIMCGVNLNTPCTGYELTKSLTFDRDGDVRTYNTATYALDSGDHHATYFPVTGGTGGWLPIGDATNPFSTTFEGNGFYIRGLAVRRNQTYIGMFGRTSSGAVIRNIRLTNNLADYTGNSDNDIYVGGLVAYNDGGTISASHAGGPADGGDGEDDRVGGLVGENNSGTITASYATGDVDGGDGDTDRVGGLVGSNIKGTITASYATGDADGGDGRNDYVGGLVGWNSDDGTITASYATGNADGGTGNVDRVGGLVGVTSQTSTITASYATGDADGGAGDYDDVGGLVGWNNGTITASYATGDADGGGDNYGSVGGLVGRNPGTITASYGFGTLTNRELFAGADDSGSRPSGVGVVGSGMAGARKLTAPSTVATTAVPAAWDQASNNTQNAWDFGTTAQAPALRYADYDGAGNTYGCGSSSTATIVIPNRVPAPGGGFTSITCGTTLLGGPQPR